MKRLERITWGCALILAVSSGVVLAVAHTLNYTAGQDTIIQTKLVGAYNREHCRSRGLPASCTSANLVSNGCVVVTVCNALGFAPGCPFSTQNVESCVIFSPDAAGEDAMLQELANQGMAETYRRARAQASADFIAGFQAASGTNQNTACTAVGQAAGCDGP